MNDNMKTQKKYKEFVLLQLGTNENIDLIKTEIMNNPVSYALFKLCVNNLKEYEEIYTTKTIKPIYITNTMKPKEIRKFSKQLEKLNKVIYINSSRS